MLAAAVGNLLWSAWAVLGPVLAERELGGAAAWGIVLSALGVGARPRRRDRAPRQAASPAGARRRSSFALFAFPLAFLAAGCPPG